MNDTRITVGQAVERLALEFDEQLSEVLNELASELLGEDAESMDFAEEVKYMKRLEVCEDRIIAEFARALLVGRETL